MKHIFRLMLLTAGLQSCCGLGIKHDCDCETSPANVNVLRFSREFRDSAGLDTLIVTTVLNGETTVVTVPFSSFSASLNDDTSTLAAGIFATTVFMSKDSSRSWRVGPGETEAINDHSRCCPCDGSRLVSIPVDGRSCSVSELPVRIMK